VPFAESLIHFSTSCDLVSMSWLWYGIPRS
jgi:hypothetical protein